MEAKEKLRVSRQLEFGMHSIQLRISAKAMGEALFDLF
jgi:hypothetical protein